MAFYPDERIGLFIDGANLFSTTKALDFDIDFKRLLDEFRKRGKLIRANYYTALLEQEDYNPLRPLVDWLDYNGFSVITKPAREFTDESGRRRIKGDMDIELAVDMIEAASYLDHIILFSGDGDFRRAIQAAQSRGARVSVVSSLKTQPSMVSDDLRRAADTFIELADLEGMIGRNGGGS
ncbi:NYN domain-containing protein [Maricaulis sp.]|uniref:LabA-like NYN domain-containing protein n=1 Tax=Maricaulis sp. TaxID=1486257 RepID=UPI001B23E8BE|nr:NYN domain-containing protein [Maricaulis sp.]MBO6765983.1 NYN domain-containing protein [Maricaulis sp.]